MIEIYFDPFRSKTIENDRNFYGIEAKFWKISFRKKWPNRNWPFRSISQHPGKAQMKCNVSVYLIEILTIEATWQVSKQLTWNIVLRSSSLTCSPAGTCLIGPEKNRMVSLVARDWQHWSRVFHLQDFLTQVFFCDSIIYLYAW